MSNKFEAIKLAVKVGVQLGVIWTLWEEFPWTRPIIIVSLISVLLADRAKLT